MTAPSQLVIATRLHLGNASAPPSSELIQSWIRNLEGMAASVGACHTLIAVDSTPKIPDYDYVQVIREHVATTTTTAANTNTADPIIVVPVTPWGKFVPALNALVTCAYTELDAKFILFVSAEVAVSAASIQELVKHCSEEEQANDSYVLVAGATLNGHVYQPNSIVTLNGRTSPWNTVAVWNVPKLILTGFLMVSDLGSNAGVEECTAIAVHQQLFPQARAKLVRLNDVEWQDVFEDDERRQWHERKMNSKLERAAAQLKLLQLVDKGIVEHC